MRTAGDETHASWMLLDNEALEKQYSSSRWSKRLGPEEVIPHHVRFAEAASKETRQKLPNRRDIPYSQKERAKLDVFGEDLPSDSFILMYVHGGYWQELEKDLSLYPAKQLYKNGIVTVIVGYTLAPQASIKEIVEEIRESVRWTCSLAANRGSKGVFLMGWSAGGHLITEVLSTTRDEDRSAFGCVRGFVTLAGIFDIRPLVPIYPNDALHLDRDSAWELSPMNKVSSLKRSFGAIKALIVAGENDSPEFKNQSKLYCEKLQKCDVISTYEELKEKDHFNLVEDLIHPDYKLTLLLKEFIESLDLQ